MKRKRARRGLCGLLAAAILVCGGILPAGKSARAEEQQSSETYWYGDANADGVLSVDDAIRVLRHLVKLVTIEGELETTLADVDHSGDIQTADAIGILRMLVNLQQREEYQKPENTPTPPLEPVNYYVPAVFSEEPEEPIGFPGADGYGKYATGGRGGRVIEVTNLEDDGPGSLREALEASGKRIVVFKVSGTIYLQDKLTIQNGDVTVAGQTAPGDGICLANYGLTVSRANNVIIRYIRVRPGDQTGTEPDSIWVQASKDVIIDHCSASWGTDETLSVSPNGYGDTYEDVSDRVSVQWSMITESIRISRLTNVRHGMGSLIRGAQGAEVTYHHNFYASHSSRAPMIGNYKDNDHDDGNFRVEFANNVVYNWDGKKSGTCGDKDDNGLLIYTTYINYLNNVFKKGPNSTNTYAFAEACIGNRMYISGNMVEGKVPEDQKSLVTFEDDVLATNNNPYYKVSGKVIDKETYFMDAPFDDSKLTGLQTAEEAEKDVLAGVGASLNRDSVDLAMIDAYQNKQGKLINSPAESLGWTNKEPLSPYLTGEPYFNFLQGKYPELRSYEGYADADHDGMSDDWEAFMNLDPGDASDGAAPYGNSSYTNLDVYLQFLTENNTAAIQR